MAYRKWWWKFGISDIFEMDSKLYSYPYNSNDVIHGDTYYDFAFNKTMNLIKSGEVPNVPTSIGPLGEERNRVWMNSDMFFSVSRNHPTLAHPDRCEVVAIDSAFNFNQAGSQAAFVKKATINDTSYFCGVIATSGQMNGGPGEAWKIWGVAQQGIYPVKFENVTGTVNFNAGNLAILSSSVAGRAVQVGRTASIGVVGVIAESVVWDSTQDGNTPIIPVIIQSFSSK